MIAPSPSLLIVSGLTAYIVTSWLLVLLRVIGATRFAPTEYWGCAIFGGTGGAALFAGRLFRAFSMTVLMPLGYVLIFELAGNAELQFGAMLGIAHGVIVGLTLPLVGTRAGCSRTPAPGLFGWRLGPATPLLMLLIYAAYGAIIGYVYVVVTP